MNVKNHHVIICTERASGSEFKEDEEKKRQRTQVMKMYHIISRVIAITLPGDRFCRKKALFDHMVFFTISFGPYDSAVTVNTVHQNE